MRLSTVRPVALAVMTLCVSAAAHAQGQAATSDGKSLVEVTDSQILVHGTVEFGDGSSEIELDSFALLDLVTQALKSHPDFTKVRIEGHTDSRGNDLANMTLSQSRAEAVLRYLVRQGISQDRLEPEGFGEEKPVAKNRTAAGRKKNRRVEIVVLEVAGRRTVAKRPPVAKVTVAENVVEARKPAVQSWDKANVGLGLFRAWRVQSRAKSAAEITFRDASQITMRENTLVIIYGAESKKARRRITTAARLERGTLRSRLGELAGETSSVALTTPSAEAVFSGGNAVLTVDGDGRSMVANHGAGEKRVAAAKVFGTKDGARAGSSVSVKSGYGTRVKKDKRPEKPRKLPPAPSWKDAAPRVFMALGASGAKLSAGFSPVDSAVRYVVQIETSSGRPVSIVDVDRAADKMALAGFPSGVYRATVSTIDADGFESIPSAPLSITVEELSFAPSEKGAGLPGWLPAPDDAAPPRALPGSKIVAPSGFVCSQDGARFSKSVLLTTPGLQTLVCKNALGQLAPGASVVVDTVSVALGAISPLLPERELTMPLTIASEVPVEPVDITFTAPAGVTIKNLRPAGVYGQGRQPFSVDVAIAASVTENVTVGFQRNGAPLADVVFPVLNDELPPIVSNVTVDPPRGTDKTAIIFAEVSDNVAVGEVYAYIRRAPTDPFVKRRLSVAAAPTFTTNLPLGEESDYVEYYIEAYDHAQNGPTQVGSADAPLHYGTPSGGGLSRMWAAAPLVAAGFAALGVGFYAVAVSVGIYQASDTQRRFEEGTVSASANDAYQSQAQTFLALDVLGAGVCLAVVAAGATGAGILWFTGEE